MLSVGMQEDLRAAAAKRGRMLEVMTILWGGTEALVALLSAWRHGSSSLAGFGLDSVIEVVSGAALFWRMSHEMHHQRRHAAERLSLRIAGSCLAALAAFVLVEAGTALYSGRGPEADPWGIGVTGGGLVCMRVLARAKRQVGAALGSAAMMTDARQTDFCMYQAAVVLAGLLIERIFHIGWADSIAALVLVPLLVRAAWLAFQGISCCR